MDFDLDRAVAAGERDGMLVAGGLPKRDAAGQELARGTEYVARGHRGHAFVCGHASGSVASSMPGGARRPEDAGRHERRHARGPQSLRARRARQPGAICREGRRVGIFSA
jgi:hypothetical protein